jgi:cobalt-zinc-cadmium efflux system outer membrane protein
MAAARAEAGVASAEAEAERARLSTVAARVKLASYWAGAADFAGVDLVSFGRLAPLAPASNAQAPEVALLEAEAERAAASVAIERARAVPDPRISAGVRKFEGTSETAWIVGLSIPLPVLDGNGAAIARAKAERARAAYEVEAGKRALARRMTSLAAEADAAGAEAQALAERVIPRGEEAFNRALEGYRMGGFSYLDVIEAQRALSDFKLKRILALTAFHRAQAALARLDGRRASQFNAEE